MKRLLWLAPLVVLATALNLGLGSAAYAEVGNSGDGPRRWYPRDRPAPG